MKRSEFIALMLTPFLAFLPKTAKKPTRVVEYPNGSKIYFHDNYILPLEDDIFTGEPLWTQMLDRKRPLKAQLPPVEFPLEYKS